MDPVTVTDKTVVIIDCKYAFMPDLMGHYEKDSFFCGDKKRPWACAETIS